MRLVVYEVVRPEPEFRVCRQWRDLRIVFLERYYTKAKKHRIYTDDVVSVQHSFFMDNLSSSILMVTKSLLVWNGSC